MRTGRMLFLMLALIVFGVLAPVALAGNDESPAYTACGPYTVKAGDTLWSIAQKFQTSVTAIQRQNGLYGALIRKGQILTVCEGAGPVLKKCQHLVVKGDSWWRLGGTYGLSVAQLKSLNPTNPNLVVGTYINICTYGPFN